MIGESISHYTILDKIGEGGMGVVHKAEDTKLKRTVALKFLPRELMREKEAKARFIREAQTIASPDSRSSWNESNTNGRILRYRNELPEV